MRKLPKYQIQIIKGIKIDDLEKATSYRTSDVRLVDLEIPSFSFFWQRFLMPTIQKNVSVIFVDCERVDGEPGCYIGKILFPDMKDSNRFPFQRSFYGDCNTGTGHLLKQ